MRKFFLWLAAFVLAVSPVLADSQGSATGGTRGTQSTLAGCQYVSSPPTLTTGQQTGLNCTNDGTLKVNASVTPTGTQDINLKEVNGTTVTVGAGAGAAGTQRVTTSTDSTIGTVTTVTTVTNPVGIKGADGSTISSVSNPVPINDAGGSITVDCGATPCAINNAQVNAVTISTGAGATGTGTQRVGVAQDTTTIAGSAPGTAGTASSNVISVQGIASGTNLPVSQGTAANLNATVVGTGTFAVQASQVPSAASTAGVAPVSSSALAANTVIKGSAGNLYSFQVSADTTLSAAAWWIMIYNATSAPGDGGVTPAKCYSLPAGATAFTGAFPVPAYFSTGITIGVSTNGCFTKAASTHAFISGDAQ